MEDEKIKKKKTILVLPVLIIVFCAFALFIYFFSSARESDKYSKKIALAQRYFDDMEYEKAIAAFKEAITINPKNEDAYFGLADIYIAIAEDGVDEYYELLGEGNDSKAEKAFENAINAIDSAEATLKKYEKNVGSKVPDKYQKKLDALGEEIDELSDAASISQTTGDLSEEVVGLDEEIDDSPEAEEIFNDRAELNKLASIYTECGGLYYGEDSIDYDNMGVFLWWYSIWYGAEDRKGRVVYKGYSTGTDQAELRFISHSDANDILNEIFYGDINVPVDLHNDDIFSWLYSGDKLYPYDGGYIFSFPAFGIEPEKSCLFNIEKTAPYHYMISYKEYYFDWESDELYNLPDGFMDNLYSYTIEELEQHECVIWGDERVLDIVLTEEGYRIYKQVN